MLSDDLKFAARLAPRTPYNLPEVKLQVSLSALTTTKRVFPTDESLLKMLFLVTRDVQRKWTMRIAHWGQILAQLSITFGERVGIVN
jgi:transposase-like protein